MSLLTRQHTARCFVGLAAILVSGLTGRMMPQEAAAATAASRPEVLWTDPGDIRSRNLYFGVGGRGDQPRGPMQFEAEDTKGANPKFDVTDSSGKKWRAKLGVEAQPETVATRLLWAVGYVVNENYDLTELEIRGLPRHLKRGGEFVGPDGRVKYVRLQSHPPGTGGRKANWDWHHNPFYGSREFNGLRVMMALISNWDLKTKNNAVHKEHHGARRELYEVSDLGSSFGMAGKSYTDRLAKNNLPKYRKTKFIAKVTSDYVDFNFPTHPPLIYLFNFPLFFGELRTRWVGRHVPRDDARWIGLLLAQLTPQQIRDAFRAANYTPEQVEGYSRAVEERIADLNKL